MQYVGLVLSKLIKGVDAWAEVKKGYVVVSIVMASIVIAIELIVAQGVRSLIEAMF